MMKDDQLVVLSLFIWWCQAGWKNSEAFSKWIQNIVGIYLCAHVAAECDTRLEFNAGFWQKKLFRSPQHLWGHLRHRGLWLPAPFWRRGILCEVGPLGLKLVLYSTYTYWFIDGKNFDNTLNQCIKQGWTDLFFMDCHIIVSPVQSGPFHNNSSFTGTV